MRALLFAACLLLACLVSVPASADHCTAAGCSARSRVTSRSVESHSEVAGVRGWHVGKRVSERRQGRRSGCGDYSTNNRS